MRHIYTVYTAMKRKIKIWFDFDLKRKEKDPEPDPDPDPDPNLWIMDPDQDPGAPKTCGSGSGSGSPTLPSVLETFQKVSALPLIFWCLVCVSQDRQSSASLPSQILFFDLQSRSPSVRCPWRFWIPLDSSSHQLWPRPLVLYNPLVIFILFLPSSWTIHILYGETFVSQIRWHHGLYVQSTLGARKSPHIVGAYMAVSRSSKTLLKPTLLNSLS